MSGIRDRIKELRRVPAGDLIANPKNWRTHPEQQKEALRGVLSEVGIADAVLARELPDGRLMLLDGHLRLNVMATEEIPVLILDVDEAEGDKILATLDPLAAMAEADANKLDELMRQVQTGSQAVADMLTELAEEEGIVSNDASGDTDKELITGWQILVTCSSDEQQRTLLDELAGRGVACRALFT